MVLTHTTDKCGDHQCTMHCGVYRQCMVRGPQHSRFVECFGMLSSLSFSLSLSLSCHCQETVNNPEKACLYVTVADGVITEQTLNPLMERRFLYP
jgi:hypothetical protein